MPTVTVPRALVWAGVLAAVVVAGTTCGGHGPRIVPVPADRPASEDVVTRFILIGDAGAPSPEDPVLAALSRAGAEIPDRTIVVFLGDNIYPRGLPPEGSDDRERAEQRLDRQIDAVRRGGTRAIFVPGNHDWARMGAGGLEAVRREEARVETAGGGRMEWLPEDGCPGPSIRDYPGVRLVVLDTQWWLTTDYPKGCSEVSDGDHLAALAAAVRPANGLPVVVAGHHPLASMGEHGGQFGLEDHLFPLRALKKWAWLPLPLIGSLYPFARENGISDQDLSGAGNRRMRAAFANAFGDHPPLVYAAGHEHALQVFRGTVARWLPVSGSGFFGHGSRVFWSDSTEYASSAGGFMLLDVTREGRFRLAVEEVDRSGTRREVYARWLMQ